MRAGGGLLDPLGLRHQHGADTSSPECGLRPLHSGHSGLTSSPMRLLASTTGFLPPVPSRQSRESPESSRGSRLVPQCTGERRLWSGPPSLCE